MTALPGQGPSDAQAPADARPAADDPVTVLYSRRVKPGREADFETWARGIVAAARQFPGHLGASVLDAPGSREYHILFTFADRRSLRAWLDSDERRRWLTRVGELLEADRGLQQLTGLETWFKLPGSNVPTMTPPPRWKMWLVSHRRVPAGARLPSLGRAQDGEAAATAASAGIPIGAADVDDLRGHADGDPGASPRCSRSCTHGRRGLAGGDQDGIPDR
jgi:hypothetical protein